jgi:hypothetical protein
VLAPLVLVFAWPVLAASFAARCLSSPEVELPTVLAYAFVLVMGAGNYIGTRHTPAALLYAAAAFLLLASVSSAVPQWLPGDRTCRAWGTLLGSMACLVAWRTARRRRVASPGLDRVGQDFRDWFGIVWSQRVRNRANEAARSRQWPFRLEWDGFAPTRPDLGEEEFKQFSGEIEHTLRWQLRRFVDPEWIDERIGGLQSCVIAAPGVPQEDAAHDREENRDATKNSQSQND